MPLVFWPSGPHPFSTAKDWLLVAWFSSGFIIAAATGRMKRRLPPRVAAAVLVWIVSLSLSASLGNEASISELMRNLFACAGFPLLLWIGIQPRKLALAVTSSATVVAVIALLQWAGLDPFLLLNLTGSIEGNSRIRIFSTLGNPNFVAALLAAVLPLTIGLPAGRLCSPKLWRALQIAAGSLQALAIVATGSRAPILAFMAAGIWLLIGGTRLKMRWILAIPAACLLLALVSPARSLDRTVSGRLYIWRIALAHLAFIPPSGYGPGAFPLRFAQWEMDYVRSNPGKPELSFSGPQEHAHNDYVEFMADYGIVGICAFFTAVGLSLRYPRRRSSGTLELGIGSSVISLLAIAIVDFPLHRPAELYLLWTQLALLWIVVDPGDLIPVSENSQAHTA